MNFFRGLRNRIRCKVKGHQYHPVCTYLTTRTGELNYSGRIKLICKCCRRGAVTAAEFQFSEESQQMMMAYDLPRD